MRRLGHAVMILGLVIVLVAAFADLLGLGQPGFGQRQGLVVILGIVVIWVGYRWKRQAAGPTR